MSDERLRELERRWQETGALADQAAFLKERVRSGGLEPERVRLAAFLGSELAKAALGAEPEPPGVEGDVDLQAWVEAIAAYGQPALARLAVAAADHSARMVSSSGIPPRAVQAAEEQILCPCDAHAEEARRRADPAWEPPDHPMRMPGDLALAARSAARTAASSLPEARDAARLAAREARRALDRVPDPFGGTGTASLRRTITRELLPWALDEGDPIRARVESRDASRGG